MNSRLSLIFSLLALATSLAAQPTVTSTTPANNARNVALNSDVSAAFSQAMSAATSGTFVMHRTRTRHFGGTYSGQNTGTLSHNPTNDYAAGERVSVTLTNGLQNLSAQGLSAPRVFQFTTAAGTGPGYFTDNTSNLPFASQSANAIIAADFNGDGNPDLAIANQSTHNRIFLQSGGSFVASSTFGSGSDASYALDAGDIDGDGDLDLVVGNFGGADYVFFNNGAGAFTSSSIVGGNGTTTTAVKFADFDKDGDLDLFAAAYGQQSRIFTNNGSGVFSFFVNVGISTRQCNSAAVGDMDNDGDVDIIMVSQGNTTALAQNEIYLNNGSGTGFNSSAFGTGTDPSTAVDVGDIDGDGDLDLLVGNGSSVAPVAYTNNGSGTMTVAHTFTGFASTTSAKLFDADGDGDLDAALGSSSSDDSVFLGDGGASFGSARSFGKSGQNQTRAMASVDVDSDGDLDLIVAVQGSSFANRVHYNEIGQQSISHSLSPASAHEAIGNVTVTVSRTGSTSGAVSVDYATSDGSASNGVDYTSTSGTLNWANGDGANKTFTIAITEDAAVEMNETINVVLSNVSGATLSASTVVLTILDNDTQPTVAFSQVGYSVGEDVGNAPVQVELSAPYQQTVSVAYASGGGSATPGSDYTAVNDSLTFMPGETSKTINVPIVDDANQESTEDITMTLSGPSNATLGAITISIVSITDNDAMGLSFAFDQASINIAEDGTTATVTVNLSQATAAATSVDYATSNGTATSGSDYTATSGTLSFASMETTKSFTVDITEDALDEDDETITITLSNPTGASLPATATLTITVTDNDASPDVGLTAATLSVAEDAGSADLTVTLSTASGRSVTVNYSTGDVSAGAGSDYTMASGTLTFSAGETSKTISVAVIDDNADEDAETLSLTLTSPSNATIATAVATITINDNDAAPSVAFDVATAEIDEDMGPASLTIELSAASGKTVTVDYATSNGSATSGSDYTADSGTLTFTPGQTSKTVMVAITDDNLDEADETIEIDLSAPAQAVLGTNDSLTLTIKDDEETPMVSIDSATYSVTEGTANIVIDVSLTTTSAVALSVDYDTANVTASSASDYTAANTTLSFAAMETMKTITIAISDDAVFEPSETFTLTLSNPATGLLLGTTTVATVTIDDDEAQPTLGFATAAPSATETAGTVNIVLSLSGTTQEDVTVEFSAAALTATSPDDFDAIATQMVTIGAGTTTKNVPITLKEDLLDEDDETIGLSIANPTIAALGADTSTFTIIDNDAMPSVAFLAASATENEDAGTVTLKVVLSTASGRALTVDFTTVDAAAIQPDDYALAMGTLNFAAGDVEEEIVVTIVDDALIEGIEGFHVDLSNPANATLDVVTRATVTILDDESPPELIFAQAMPSGAEDAATLDVEVKLTKASGLVVSVDYATNDVTAFDSFDYIAQSGTLTFAANETSKIVSIDMRDDMEVEDNETFTITLSNATNATISGTGISTVTILEDDQPQLNIDAATYSIAENGVMLDISLSLSVMSFMPIDVDVVSSDLTAEAGIDFTGLNQSLTFLAGETSKSVSLLLLDDGIDEPDETLEVALFNVVNAAVGMQSTSIVTILDDEVPILSFDQAMVTVSETALTLNLGYSLDIAAYQEITFDAASADLTALAGADFEALSESLTIAVGDTTGLLTLTLIDDVLIEGDKTMRLDLSNIVGADAGTDSSTITITSDDLVPTISIQPATLDLAEGSGLSPLTLVLSQVFNQSLSVRVQTQAGTASAGSDYKLIDETFLFLSGEQMKTFLVEVFDDGRAEEDETFSLVISNPNGALIDATADTSLLTILNDDAPPPPVPPSFIELQVLDADNAYHAGETITIEANMGVGGLDLRADLSILDAAFSTDEAIPYFGSGRYRLTTAALNAATLIEGRDVPIEVRAMDSAGQMISGWLAITIDDSAPNGRMLFNAPHDNVPAGDLKITLAFDEPVVDLPLMTISGLGVLNVTNEVMVGAVPGLRFTHTLTVPNGGMGVGIVTVSPTQDVAGNPAILPAGMQIMLTGGAPSLLADAGQDQAIASPQSISLDGRGSLGASSFQWSQVAGPQLVTIGTANNSLASINITLAGDYLFQLDVSDGAGMASDTVVISLGDGVPSVDAGPDIVLAAEEILQVGQEFFTSVGLGATVSDPSNDELFLTWHRVSGPTDGNLRIADRNSAATELLVYGSVIESGIYLFRVDVADAALLAKGLVVSDTVRMIVIGEGTRPPSANAGPDTKVDTGTLVVLNGSRSTDPDAVGPAPLGYSWQMIERPSSSSATLQGTTNQNTAFSADAAGRYVVELMVTDGDGLQSLADRVVITAFDPSNNLPRAGISQTPAGVLSAGQSATLSAMLDDDGIGFEGSLDFEGDDLTALWTFLDGPSGIVIADPDLIEQTFVFPSVGVYRFRVDVNDGVSDGIPLIAHIEVSSNGLAMPVAVASIDAIDDPDGDGHVTYIPSLGVNRQFDNRHVDLSALGSSVSGGLSAVYRWSQRSGPVVGLVGATAASASFTPIAAGVYTFDLRVSDGSARYADTSISVAIDTHDSLENPTGNALPRVSAPADVMIEPGEEVVLTGSGFDPNGAGVTLSWIQISGPPVNFATPSAGVMSFTPSGDADYLFALYGDDGIHEGLSKQVRVTVRSEVVIEPPPPTGGGGGGGGGGGCALSQGNNAWLWLLLAILPFACQIRRSRRTNSAR